MQDHTDNMTQTRGSIQQKSSSFWDRFKVYICPCILPPPTVTISLQEKNDMQSISKASQTNRSSNNYKQKYSMQVPDNINLRRSLATHRKTSEEIGDLELTRREGLLNKKPSKAQKEFRQTLNINMGYSSRMRSIEEVDCSVCSLTENELLSIGINDRHLLVKIITANINANLSLLKKQLQSPKRKKDKMEQNIYDQFEFNKFWSQRYVLFQKFDEGIKIAQSSWARTPPEQVSDFIANKCNGAKVILEGFAGVGGTSIRLASINSCVKVIANDYNQQKTKFLLNNAKIYEVDSCIELNEQDFLKIQKKNIDVVFVQPPLGKLQIDGHRSISIVDFEPTLDKIIMKSMKLAPNLLMLLPPQTNIDVLCSCINKCSTQLKKMKDFCSLTIQKIYYQNQLLYILVSIGKLVQTEIKLSQQLEYIYGRLKKSGQKYFKHKKIIKKLREEQGMLELFNLVKESQRKAKEKIMKSNIIGREEYPIDSFYQLIILKNLIPKQKLQKIIEEQNAESKKRVSLIQSLNKMQDHEISMSPVMQEEKLQQNQMAFRQSEQTQSDYSHYSYLSGLQKSNNPSSGSSRLMRLQSDSFSSVIIKRTLNGSKQKRDISPNSKNGSPVTPSRRAAKNRVTQILQKKQNQEIKKKSTQDHM